MLHFIGGLFGTAIVVVLAVVLEEFAYKFFDRHPQTPIVFFFLLGPLAIPIIVAYIRLTIKVKKDYMPAWEKIKIAPSEELVDKVTYALDRFGINNHPQIWNELRGIWLVVNECPDITTAKKTEFRNFLMTKGLKLVGNDKNIIDNYSFNE